MKRLSRKIFFNAMCQYIYSYDVMRALHFLVGNVKHVKENFHRFLFLTSEKDIEQFELIKISLKRKQSDKNHNSAKCTISIVIGEHFETTQTREIRNEIREL